MTAKGLSITELSGIADMGRTTLSAWLHGRRPLTVAQFERLLKALGGGRLDAACRAVDEPGRR